MNADRGTSRASSGRMVEPCGIVIFGSSGDLAGRKLLPALYDLYLERQLPDRFYVVGLGRRDWSDDLLRQHLGAAVAGHSRLQPFQQSRWQEFVRHLHYQRLDVGDRAGYQRLAKRLQALDESHGTGGNYLFYLAVAPSFYPELVSQLAVAGLPRRPPSAGWTRVVVEKPLGQDRSTARQLNAQLQQVFGEDQVYRMDHYLGKETVQNLAVFRFANGIFEPIWDRRYIDHVQITVAETLGVENRAGTYEQAGAVRDMVQNHLLQLLCLVAMEPPVSFAAEPVRQEKLKVLQSVRPLAPGAMGAVAVRGQYGPGAIDGQSVAGYRQEPGVAANSGTETFAVLRLEINNWRWAGVPLYLRTGKRLRRKSSEISIEFREAPLELFACTAMKPCEPNLLRLRIQPEEGIGLRVIAKTPGLEVIGHSVEMDYRYGARFEAETPSAYETLLLDCLQGEGMLFAAGDWIETAWDLLTPLLEAWASEPAPDFPNYPAGSWGPRAAEEFLARTGRRWHFE